MQNIIVAYDFSAHSDKALAIAVTIARQFKAKLWLIHVADPEPGFIGYKVGPLSVREQVAYELRDEHKKLHEIAEKYSDQSVEITPIFVQGPIIDTIFDQAEKVDADLIVAGHKGKSKLESALIGSVSRQLVERLRTPILIC